MVNERGAPATTNNIKPHRIRFVTANPIEFGETCIRKANSEQKLKKILNSSMIHHIIRGVLYTYQSSFVLYNIIMQCSTYSVSPKVVNSVFFFH